MLYKVSVHVGEIKLFPWMPFDLLTDEKQEFLEETF